MFIGIVIGLVLIILTVLTFRVPNLYSRVIIGKFLGFLWVLYLGTIWYSLK